VVTKRWIALAIAMTTAAGAAVTISDGPAGAALTPTAAPSHAYRADDYADGRAMSILPPGENGLVTATDAAALELTGARPPASNDQLAKYSNLLYHYSNLTDAKLGSYFDDESFGVKAADVTRTETPTSGVTIYRDTHDVPHV
jgi:hypothetical protein